MRIILGASIIFMVGSGAWAQPDTSGDGQYLYVARVDGEVRQSGPVTTPNGLRWNCEGSACSIRGPWASPAVGACRELAALIGRISSYGRQGAMLSPAELAECNAGAPDPIGGSPAGDAPPRSLPAAPATATTSRAADAASCPITGFAASDPKINRRSSPIGTVYERVCYNCRYVACSAGDLAIGGYADCGDVKPTFAAGLSRMGLAQGCSHDQEGYTASCSGPGGSAHGPARVLTVACVEAR